MNLNISGLKYFGKNMVGFGSSEKAKPVDAKSAENLISKHNQQTDEQINMYSEQYESGEISSTEYKLAKLEASAKDLIYQMGVYSLYNIDKTKRSV